MDKGGRQEQTLGQELLIRADATTSMGTGHVMRCLALGQAWLDDGGEATFISHCEAPALRRRITEAGCGLIEIGGAHSASEGLEATMAAAADHPGAAIVLDGYQFDAAYQEAVKRTGRRLLVFDDYGHAKHYCADLVVNQNPGAEDRPYRCEPNTQIMRGPRYAVLRPEFAPWRSWERTIPKKARHILVTMGGSDPGNVTEQVIRALALLDVPGVEATVVTGAGNPHVESLRQVLADVGPWVTLVHDAADMAGMMAEADMAISSGGTTGLELAFMGLPSVMIALVENQASTVRHLARHRAAWGFGYAAHLDERMLAVRVASLLRDPSARREASRRGRALVDGFGAERVVAALKGETGANDSSD
jgi:UDP-2,4-diacetamido-2,4,6-trideoxy-beta-L-altropyranose hydrolase